MNDIYYYTGFVTFWVIVACFCAISCFYLSAWLWSIRARFWIFQIWERLKATKTIEAIKNNRTPAVSYWSIKHFHRMFADPTYKYYRRSIQLFRKFYIKHLGQILQEQEQSTT